MEDAMRIPLWPIALCLLPLGAGCLGSSSLSQALSAPEVAPSPKQKGRRDMLIDAVAAAGGKIDVDRARSGTDLIRADLHGIRSAGAVLDAFAPLTRVQAVNLYDTGFTDADLARLRGIGSLNSLNLSSTWVSDEGLASLTGLPNLHELYLDNTRVSDAGMQHLRNFPNLKTLEVVRTGVTDDGLVHVAGLKLLEKLSLSGRSITDRSLVHLKGLRNLKKLYLASTRVTTGGVADLQAALPHLHIYR
jgi:hypothetical protein